MKNVSHKKGWISGEVQIHVDLPNNLLIKINMDTRSWENYFNIKLFSNAMPEKSYKCEYRIDLLDNGDP